MKKLTWRYRRHLLHRARAEARRYRVRRPEAVSRRREDAFQAFLAARAALPPKELDYETRADLALIVPPPELSLLDNYEDTLAFILDVRALFCRRSVPGPDGKGTRSIFAEFAALRSVQPSAGLVLAAEIDRWRLSSGKKPKAHDAEWHPPVRRYFRQAGLFELLGIHPQDCGDEFTSEDGDIQTLRFVRGFSVHGALGSQLRDRLEALCGKSIGPRLTVYEAIAEAIANTRHAYPSGTAIWPMKLSGRWWASGTWDPIANKVSVQLYDQGVGIPATLPKSPHWSDLIKSKALRGRLHPERTDDRLLEAALEVGRTSTGQQGRGKGLAEMANWIDKRGNGFLRIMSGRGVVSYKAGGDVTREIRHAPFPGTLVEWEIELGE